MDRKEKMRDQLLWLMIDFDANDLIRLNASVQRIAIRSFVRVTCCRGGAMATDYHDRAGLCVQCADGPDDAAAAPTPAEGNDAAGLINNACLLCGD